MGEKFESLIKLYVGLQSRDAITKFIIKVADYI